MQRCRGAEVHLSVVVLVSPSPASGSSALMVSRSLAGQNSVEPSRICVRNCAGSGIRIMSPPASTGLGCAQPPEMYSLYSSSDWLWSSASFFGATVRRTVSTLGGAASSSATSVVSLRPPDTNFCRNSRHSSGEGPSASDARTAALGAA